MKNGIKATLIAAIVSLLVIGCSQQSNPVDPASSAAQEMFKGRPNAGSGGNDGGGTVTTGADPIFITIPDYDSVIGETEITKTIDATTGGTMQAKIMYYKNGSKVFSVSAQIKFPQGSLDRTRAITIRMDPSTLGFTFLPHGITFGVPALLTIDTYGLDLTGFTSKNTDLWYKENGDWLQSFQGRLIKLFPQNGKMMINDIKLEHFSQYAFGRAK